MTEVIDVLQKYPCKTLVSEPQRIPVTDEFKAKNRLKLLPYEELLRDFKEFTKNDKLFFDESDVMLYYLKWEDAKSKITNKEYIEKIESGEKEWRVLTDEDETVQDFLDYMVFAWGKAEDRRGLSAIRSVMKLGTWLHILSRSDLHGLIHTDGMYDPYGAPALIAVCKDLGIDVPGSLISFASRPCGD